MAAVKTKPSIVLVVPAGTLMLKEPPSAKDHSRKATQRHPLYIDSVEMGARIRLSWVPPANTTSGDLDKVETDRLYKTLGAQLFTVSGERCRICLRQEGGPPLDPLRLADVSLDWVCSYLTMGWANSLGAAPETWVRLGVGVAMTDELEKACGPGPGSGVFVPWPLTETSAEQRTCGYCASRPVIGAEMSVHEKPVGKSESGVDDVGSAEVTFKTGAVGVADVSVDASMTVDIDTLCQSDLDIACGKICEAGEDVQVRAESTGIPVCHTCSAFVSGSPYRQRLEALAQYLSRPLEQVVGSADEDLDVCLDAIRFRQNIKAEGGLLPSQVADQLDLPGRGPLSLSAPKHPPQGQKTNRPVRQTGGLKMSLASQAAAAVSSARVADLATAAWQVSAVPTDAAVFAASGLLHVKSLPEWWSTDEVRAKRSLEHDISVAAGCPQEAVIVVDMLTEVIGGGVLIGFALLNPSVVFSQQTSSTTQTLNREPIMLFWQLACELGSGLPVQIPGASSSGLTMLVAGQTISVKPCSLIYSVVPESKRMASDLKAAKSQEAVLESIESLETNDDGVGSEFQTLIARTKKSRFVSGSMSLTDKRCVSSPHISMTTALACFQPTATQLTLRLRELASTREAARCDQLLSRWGRGVTDGGAVASLAVVSRDPMYFRGQSALDMAISAGDRATVDVLLTHVPETLGGHCLKPNPENDIPTQSEHFPTCLDVLGEQRQSECCESMHCPSLGNNVEALVTLPPSSMALTGFLNSPDPVTGHTPLYAAALYPSDYTIGVVIRLVKRSADANLRDPQCSEPPLVAAVRRGEASLVRAFVDLSADINVRAADGQTALQVSICRGEQDVFKEVLQTPGCDIDGSDLRGRTALVTALRCRNCEFISHLIEARCDVDARDTGGAAPILHAAAVPDAETCALLLSSWADCNAVDPTDGSHVLFSAFRRQNIGLLQALLRAKANVHARHPQERRLPLHFAAALRMSAVAEALIAFHAEVDGQSDIGDTPLRLAVQTRSLDVIEILCEAAADPNSPNKSGCAAIHAAVASGKHDLVQLLMRYRADVHLADSRRWRPLHYGATSGSADVVECLLHGRANPHARSFHGRTACELARSGTEDAMKVRDVLQRSNPLVEDGGGSQNLVSRVGDVPKITVVFRRVEPKAPPFSSRPRMKAAAHDQVNTTSSQALAVASSKSAQVGIKPWLSITPLPPLPRRGKSAETVVNRQAQRIGGT
eukprot:TRINITY_DN25710_c0_g1_i1.p1 TRINITY_DN25710_c0_g1~~TRINITY_DN25710_c0_g1_i1.p1  ORF type:complete len:1406 (-),score=194.74 TRINITY_DN25710_c0_g1_i1:104-3790(-)